MLRGRIDRALCGDLGSPVYLHFPLRSLSSIQF
jgi:hypothetical protein